MDGWMVGWLVDWSVCVCVCVCKQVVSARSSGSGTDNRKEASAMNTKPTTPVAMLNTITFGRVSVVYKGRASI